MKTLGLLGGMSWESTALYYRHLNQLCQTHLGGLHSARIILWSFDFAEVAALQHVGNWEAAAALMVDSARRLEAAGANGLLICTNTMHSVAGEIETKIGLPLLHIADATAAAIKAAGSRRPALLGTAFTMEQGFYRDRLLEKHDIATIIPDDDERAFIHRTIYEELCRGRVEASSRSELARIVARLESQGADGVILGCTELPMAVGAEDTSLPLFDTTALHASYAFDFAMAETWTVSG